MNYIVIVAGGKGQRMGNEVPKQFLLIGKKPICILSNASTSTIKL